MFKKPTGQVILLKQLFFQEILVGIINVWMVRALPGQKHAAKRRSAKMERTHRPYAVGQFTHVLATRVSEYVPLLWSFFTHLFVNIFVGSGKCHLNDLACSFNNQSSGSKRCRSFRGKTRSEEISEIERHVTYFSPCYRMCFKSMKI